MTNTDYVAAYVTRLRRSGIERTPAEIELILKVAYHKVSQWLVQNGYEPTENYAELLTLRDLFEADKVDDLRQCAEVTCKRRRA